MFSESRSLPVRAAQQQSGSFLFELIISMLMIVAIAVLAFPTYQDFAPEPGIDGERHDSVSQEVLAESGEPGNAGSGIDGGSADSTGSPEPKQSAGEGDEINGA